MIKHAKMIEWDNKMKSLFDEIDDYLENHYGTDYTLHPNRMPRHSTANKEMDGLFNVGVSYSAGYGSKMGKGYVVEIHMSTLEHVPVDIKNKIEGEVERKIEKLLPKYFPGRKLEVEKDRNSLKIYGDLSLGAL
ncbi:MAG: hypothetical protein PF447_02340 [Spirochaetaceae bacterium]|jgi:hypothetical protein|nr:hypothetical protein [Spirochaetaceae bacterium]